MARRLIFAICLLTFAICHSVRRLEARSGTALRAFNEGVKLFNAKQFREAVSRFDDAISSDQEFPEAFYARGACKYYLKSFDSALMDLSDALRLKPDYLDARALRGAVNYEADRWDAALDDFNAVLSKNPNDAQSLLGRAVIMLKRQNLAAAEKDFRAFLRVRPDDPMAPKVRQVLASIKGGSPSAAEEESSEPTRGAPAAARPTRAAPVLSSAELQKLVDSLLSRSVSDSYDRKVLRGEKTQAVGDAHRVFGVPKGKNTPEADVQIVEPR